MSETDLDARIEAARVVMEQAESAFNEAQDEYWALTDTKTNAICAEIRRQEDAKAKATAKLLKKLSARPMPTITPDLINEWASKDKLT